MNRALFCLTLTLPLLAHATPVSQCSTDTDCRVHCGLLAAEQSRPVAPLTTFTAATCEYSNTGAARDFYACYCTMASGASYAMHSSAYGACTYTGRDGTCLFDASEFKECDAGAGGVSTACGGQCGDLQTRIQADQSRMLSISVLGSRCYGGVSWKGCDCAMKSGDRCFVGNTQYDCALDGDGILDEHGRTRGCSCGAAPGAAVLGALLLALGARRRRR